MTRAQRSENTGIRMARRGTLFSFGLTCSNHMNVPKSKRCCVSGEEQNDNRPETEAEWKLQSDAGSDGTSEATDRRATDSEEVVASRELCADVGKITIAQARNDGGHLHYAFKRVRLEREASGFA